jgi:predicted component of type VI protein secretion system
MALISLSALRLENIINEKSHHDIAEIAAVHKYFLFNICDKKNLPIGHIKNTNVKETVNSVRRYREIFRS